VSVISFSQLLPIASVSDQCVKVSLLTCASAATRKGVSITLVAPDSQPAAVGCAAVIKLHFCGLFSMLSSGFMKGKLRHRAARIPVRCSVVGALTEGQESRVGCSAVAAVERCLVLHCAFSALCCAFLLSQQRESKEIRLALKFFYGSSFPT